MLHISRRGVRRMLLDGRLAGGIRIGKKWLIVRSELERYIVANVIRRTTPNPKS